MAVTVNKLDYIYKKLLNEVKSKMNDTIEINDEEYGIIYEGNDSGNQEGNDEPVVDPSEEDTKDLKKIIVNAWGGDFGMYYEYEYQGRVYRFDSYDTNIVFYLDHDAATYGYRKQVDYYEYGPYAYQHYRFRWHISSGDLILEYPYDPSLNTVIHDYHAYSDRFYGYFGTSNTKFYLYKLTDYYDFVNYNGDYYYDPRSNWHENLPYGYY